MHRGLFLFGCATLLVAGVSAQAGEGKQFNIGDKYVLTAPADWVSKQPKINFIDHEFEVPAAEGNSNPGRVTVMGAGGSVEENVSRWESQFKGVDGQPPKAEIKEIKVADQPVHLVDLSGTYLDKAGPFVPGPATERPDYRMLGAIISTDAGRYFVKLYGPAKTITATQPGFIKMVEAMKGK